MLLQLYDRGSPQGKRLFIDLQTVCHRLQIDYDPEYIQDMKPVYDMGIQGKTILLLDRQVVLVDQYPPPAELEDLISDYIK
jgi:hypothetical protein